MIRLTKGVFSDLAIWMMGFGMLVGVIFPFFMAFLGMDPAIAYTLWFFVVCILAGLIVGAVNILLAHLVVGGRLNLLSAHMGKIEDKLHSISGSDSLVDCSAEDCHLTVDSTDAIGRSSASFNSLVDTLSSSLQLEMQIRSYTRMLTTHLEVEVLCQKALSSLLELFSIDGGAVLVESGGSLKTLGSSGLANAEGLGKNPQVLETLRQLTRKRIDIPVEAQIDGVVATFRPQTVVLFPIIYKGLGMGVVALATSSPLSSEVENHLDLFISSLALALHNAVTHDQIQRLAAVDPLTGVYNRRFGLTRLREEFIRSIKQNTTLGVLMIDVDFFKEVNDTYGHTVGDRVLQGIATSARSQLREGDLLVRLGGDEFMVVLLGASGDDVLEVGEAIRRTVSERTTSWGEQKIQVTVSIGGSSLATLDVKDEQELIEAADKALYHVKESGRNRVGV